VDGRNPAPPWMVETRINHGINHLPTGVGFLPSTVWVMQSDWKPLFSTSTKVKLVSHADTGRHALHHDKCVQKTQDFECLKKKRRPTGKTVENSYYRSIGYRYSCRGAQHVHEGMEPSFEGINLGLFLFFVLQRIPCQKFEPLSRLLWY